MKRFSEDNLIERPSIDLLRSLGWHWKNCYHETYGEDSTLGRRARTEVVLLARLRMAIEKINPGIDKATLNVAVEAVGADRSALSPVAANKEISKLLRDGVRVKRAAADLEVANEQITTVRLIDWAHWEDNDFFLASQFWIKGQHYTRRADLVGFVNGLPLLFCELKTSHKSLKTAYERNLRDYKSTVPQIFWFNGVIVLSNGTEARVGSVTAEWEHFAEWRLPDDELLDALAIVQTWHGVGDPRTLLDLAENFTLFVDKPGRTDKILAKYHQYYGVNDAINSLLTIREHPGKLGVFWHTQGSGKSVSMILFAEKVSRKVVGDWSFVIVTDRLNLDEHLHREFSRAGIVASADIRADSGESLKELLRLNNRYVFTVIEKFRVKPGEPFPVLSHRQDIIVLSDEAHRSQHGMFASNMRRALPNAAFIGFTATPLMRDEQRTRQIFGDYISIYDFQQSISDRTTVPLYYENRIPELQLTEDALKPELDDIVDSASLGDEEQAKLEREFSREYHLVTRTERLRSIAADLVDHFLGRGFAGKAMVISIDKATAVRMYDFVQAEWSLRIAQVRSTKQTEETRERLAYLETTDMAVIVSQSQNEVEDLLKKQADIIPHRQRLNLEALDLKFQNPTDPLRLVFVCAMWTVGFDAPNCSTIYLDKPMRDHALMQAIARANRVFPGKASGTIIDYIGVFRNLRRALAVYSSGSGLSPTDFPVQPKARLISEAIECLEWAIGFCGRLGIDLRALADSANKAFELLALVDRATNLLVSTDAIKEEFLDAAARFVRLFKAIQPDPALADLLGFYAALNVLMQRIRVLEVGEDVSAVVEQVDAVLDRSIVVLPYRPHDGEGREIDLTRLDFEGIKVAYSKGYKNIAAQALRRELTKRVDRLTTVNPTRRGLAETLKALVDNYNSGSANIDLLFDELLDFSDALTEEEHRAVREGLSEEELAMFDLVGSRGPSLNASEERAVKAAVKKLIAVLKDQKIVIDWRKKEQSQAAVWLTISDVFDELPDRISRDTYRDICAATYQHVFDSYYGPNDNLYSSSDSPR